MSAPGFRDIIETVRSRVLPLAYGTLLLCLALFKAVGHWRMHGLHGSRLVFILVKDQVLYFAL